MHSLLNGILSFGLVNVPVGVGTAASRAEKGFKVLHRQRPDGKLCLSPISAPKQCPVCQADNLELGDLVKGFEFTKGNFVVIDEAIMKEITPVRSGVITLDKYVEWRDLDEMYVERNYFLIPKEMLVEPYKILSTALGAKEACGMGKAALFGKEYPVAVWARENGVLVLSLLFEEMDVRSDEEIVQSLAGVTVAEQKQDLGNMLVAASIRDLVPQEDLVTSQRALTDEYIASLISGSEFVAPTKGPELTPTTSIEEALIRSLELARVA